MVKRNKLSIPVPHVRINPVEEMQSFLTKKKIVKPKKTTPIRYVTRIYRKFSDKHRRMVILLRYGSLTNFSKIRMGWTDIAKLTNICV